MPVFRAVLRDFAGLGGVEPAFSALNGAERAVCLLRVSVATYLIGAFFICLSRAHADAAEWLYSERMPKTKKRPEAGSLWPFGRVVSHPPHSSGGAY